jgi:ABC-type amino acid transport substrate-binding protein
MRRAISTLTWLLFALPQLGWAASVTACAEPSNGPPWLYAVKDAAGRNTGELAGFTLDTVRQAFASIGLELRLRGDLPLIRCMEMVASHQVDFAIGVYHDPERAKHFAYSTPYKVLTPQIFFSASHPIAVRTVKDLSNYHGCGRHG